MKYLTIALALVLSACTPDAPLAPSAPVPQDHLAAATARKKPPRVSAADEPVISVTPATITLTVGQSTVAAITYTQAFPGNFIAFFWGCLPYPACNGVAQIYPTPGSGVVGEPAGGATATLKGLSPGTMTLWASDGLGAWAYAAVEVLP